MYNCTWGYSSAGRALEWHSRGQRFDPAYLHHQWRKSMKAPDILSGAFFVRHCFFYETWGSSAFFVIQKHSKHKKCAISSPLWTTRNDVQKLHGLVFAHYCGAVLVQEVLCSIVKLIQVEAERSMQFGDKVIDEVAAYIAQIALASIHLYSEYPCDARHKESSLICRLLSISADLWNQ